MERQAATAEGDVAQLNGGQVRAAAASTVAAKTPAAQRVRHRVLVSKKGVAAARRLLESEECVVRRVHEACGREWCSCAEGMRARVSSTLF